MSTETKSVTLTHEQAVRLKEYVETARRAAHDLEALAILLDKYGQARNDDTSSVSMYLSAKLDKMSADLFEAPNLPER